MFPRLWVVVSVVLGCGVLKVRMGIFSQYVVNCAVIFTLAIAMPIARTGEQNLAGMLCGLMGVLNSCWIAMAKCTRFRQIKTNLLGTCAADIR